MVTSSTRIATSRLPREPKIIFKTTTQNPRAHISGLLQRVKNMLLRVKTYCHVLQTGSQLAVYNFVSVTSWLRCSSELYVPFSVTEFVLPCSQHCRSFTKKKPVDNNEVRNHVLWVIETQWHAVVVAVVSVFQTWNVLQIHHYNSHVLSFNLLSWRTHKSIEVRVRTVQIIDYDVCKSVCCLVSHEHTRTQTERHTECACDMVAVHVAPNQRNIGFAWQATRTTVLQKLLPHSRLQKAFFCIHTKSNPVQLVWPSLHALHLSHYAAFPTGSLIHFERFLIDRFVVPC